MSNWATYTWTGSKQQPAAAPATIPNYFGRTPEAADVLKPVSLARVPGADEAIYNSFTNLSNNRTQSQADTNAYRNAITQTNPAIGGWNAQEVQDLTNVFSPSGYEAQFGQIRADRANAMRRMDSSIFADTIRALGLNRAGSGGVSGAGLGSYLARLASSQAGKLRASEAYDASTQSRADLAALLAARTGAQGRRQALTDSMLTRLLNPSAAEATSLGSYNTGLNQALQLALANLVSAYGLNSSAAQA